MTATDIVIPDQQPVSVGNDRTRRAFRLNHIVCICVLLRRNGVPKNNLTVPRVRHDHLGSVRPDRPRPDNRIIRSASERCNRVIRFLPICRRDGIPDKHTIIMRVRNIKLSICHRHTDRPVHLIQCISAAAACKIALSQHKRRLCGSRCRQSVVHENTVVPRIANKETLAIRRDTVRMIISRRTARLIHTKARQRKIRSLSTGKSIADIARSFSVAIAFVYGNANIFKIRYRDFALIALAPDLRRDCRFSRRKRIQPALGINGRDRLVRTRPLWFPACSGDLNRTVLPNIHCHIAGNHHLRLRCLKRHKCHEQHADGCKQRDDPILTEFAHTMPSLSFSFHIRFLIATPLKYQHSNVSD